MRSIHSSFARRTALGCTAVAVIAGGLLVAAPAFADPTVNTYADLQSAMAAGSSVRLGSDIDASGQTLQIPESGTETLDLAGHVLKLDTLQLTTIDASSSPPTVAGSSLTIVDTTGGQQQHGTGHLIVTHTSDASTAAIEVDSGSTLLIKQAVVDATANPSGTAAGIGGGGLVDQVASTHDIETAGTIDVADGAVVTASGSKSGAGIGGGRFGPGGTITIEQTAAVTATTSGSAAAIGSGESAKSGSPTILIDGYGTNQTGGVGALVTATAHGRGAAIGGGFEGAGGSISIRGYSSVTASSDEAGIGDGDSSVGSSNIAIDDNSTVTATGGANGGAGIGGSNLAYGNDSVSIGENSVVTARGTAGPGIGGERNRYSTNVTVSGASTVTAIGGGNGAGIGGGDSAGPTYQSSATLGLSGTADLTVGTSTPSISAIGAGAGSGTGSISLTGGTLHLGAGQQITVPSLSTFTNNSLFVNAGTLTTSGSGVIDNEAVILNTGTVSGTVKGYAYTVSYNPGVGSLSGGGTTQPVFADTLQQAQLGMPSAVPSVPGTFVGWNTKADGTGAGVSTSSSLSGIVQTSSGAPVTVPLYAIYQLYPVLGGPSLPRAATHKSYSGSVAVTYGTGPLSYSETGSFPAGLRLDSRTGAITGTPTTVGSYRFTVRVSNALSRHSGRTVSRVYTITVGKPLAAKLSATVKANHAFGVRLTNLLWHEPLRIVQTGPKKATYSAKAKSGSYTLAFRHGLAKKGKYTLTITAQSTDRVLVVHLTVH